MFKYHVSIYNYCSKLYLDLYTYGLLAGSCIDSQLTIRQDVINELISIHIYSYDCLEKMQTVFWFSVTKIKVDIRKSLTIFNFFIFIENL